MPRSIIPLIFILLVAASALLPATGCHKTNHESDSLRFLDGIIMKSDSFDTTGRHIDIRHYYAKPLDERSVQAVYKTYEFVDTSITLCWFDRDEWQDNSIYVFLNTQDSLFIFLDQMSDEYYNFISNDINRLIKYIRKNKDALPIAELTTGGIVDYMRDSLWSVKLKKEYLPSGVLLSKPPFKYLAKYNFSSDIKLTEKGSQKKERKRLPPFLIYDFADFCNMFVDSTNRKAFLYYF